MSRGKSLCAATFCCALLTTIASTALAQSADRGMWELTLAGTGQADKNFDNAAIGVNAGVGYFLLDNFQLSLRQLIAYVKNEDGNAFNAATSLALDYHFPLGDRKQWQPFIGINGGYYYGDTFNNTFEYAPEAGVKYFANETTFIYFRGDYEIFAKDVTGNSNSADRQWTFTLGIGFRF
jgi:hypothetical protein